MTKLSERVPAELSSARLDTGTPSGRSMLRTGLEDVAAVKGQQLSALGESFEVTPMVLPIRAHLDRVKRLLKGDLHIGRGSRQRSLAVSRYLQY